MKTEIKIYHSLTVFFGIVAAAYGFVTYNSAYGLDWVGFPALLLTFLMSLMIGGYLELTARTIDKRPEDDVAGEIAEAAGEYGEFSPYSWWPMPLAAGCAVIFLGLAVGLWVAAIGLVFTSIAVVGWVFEYYRGPHAH